jgi:predicted helicase
VVQKCGNRHHWEDWAADIAKIARTHIDRITGILENPENTKEHAAFKAFAEELRDDLNDSISDSDIIEMLAQHLITKPVFDALFAGYSFASQNPISQAMQDVLDVLHEHRLDKEADTLEAFYDSVRMRADGIESAAGKQKIVVELYDKFFRNAFPKMTERLGIVYTPVEVVDFILHSVNHLLKTEFNQTLGSKGVHIIDPFTGTGTFITRLLQSGLIQREELAHKYRHEIHANEIVLLAYYIAAINIEATYHDLAGGHYVPFEGICLTDTFQLYEKEDMISALLEDNSARRKRQKKLDIRVIIGNPPYSAGQSDVADDNQNVSYPNLDARIAQTYAARSSARTRTNVYDSYIRAIRWACDRIGNSGLIGYVTNASFLEANASDGLRKCLAEEFASIHVFHLRGNQRTSGETSRKEGGKIFGGGSRAPIAITLLVKNPDAISHGQIYFHDIGDYLTREEKLAKVASLGSISGITQAGGWQSISPDAHGDWLNQRDDSFSAFIPLGDNKGSDVAVFEGHTNGPITNRDSWVYNFSGSTLASKVGAMVHFYNQERLRYQRAATEMQPVKFVEKDERKIAWDGKLLQGIASDKAIAYSEQVVVKAQYRPFSLMYLYFDRSCIWSACQMPRIFPNRDAKNFVIVTTGRGATKEFCAFITDEVPDREMISKGQCFPLYLYGESAESTQPGLFDEDPAQPTRRDAITDKGLAHFQEAYHGEKLTKEDLFYYVYGLLHSPDYRERYADNLGKELPRIPRVKTAQAFWAFSQAGRALADLHLNYETVMPHPVEIVASGTLSDAAYRVEKMRYGKAKVDGKSVDDKTTLIYNDHITLRGIPLEAYDYVVNGKSALDWVVERQCVKTDKESGIVNDANAWATETMGNPKYPLELFMRVITVSLETMRIVNSLPPLDL